MGSAKWDRLSGIGLSGTGRGAAVRRQRWCGLGFGGYGSSGVQVRKNVLNILLALSAENGVVPLLVQHGVVSTP